MENIVYISLVSGLNSGRWSMEEIDLVEEENVETSRRSRSDVFRDVVWVWEIKDTKLLDILRLSVRKWVDSVENFAQYIARRLQSYGVVLEVQSNIYPISEGYMLNVSFKIRGVRESIVKSKRKILKLQAKDITTGSRKYKRAQEILERVSRFERENRDSGSPIDSPEAEEESGGIEDIGE